MSDKIIKSFSINYFTTDRSSFFIHTMDCVKSEFPLMQYRFRCDFYMIMVWYEGKHSICINELEFSNIENGVVIIKPNDLVDLCFDSSCSGVFLGFESSFFSQRYHDNVLKFFPSFQLGASPLQLMTEAVSAKITLFIELIKTEYNSTRIHKETILRSYLNILLCELQSVDKVELLASNGYDKTVSNDHIVTFLDLVELHFKSAKSPSFYAKLLCLTPNYLNKLCKQKQGSTAGQVIHKRITTEAKRLLQFSALNINEIAYELGFDSTSYFVTFFKKQEGITPDNYRRSIN